MPYQEFFERIKNIDKDAARVERFGYSRYAWAFSSLSPFLGIILVFYLGVSSTYAIILAIGVSTFLLGWLILHMAATLSRLLMYVAAVIECVGWRQLKDWEDPDPLSPKKPIP